MKTVTLSVLLVLGFGPAIVAQGPTPSFAMVVGNLSLNSFDANFLVQGPPNSQVSVLFTLDNPFTTPPYLVQVYPLMNTQTNGQGYCPFTIPVFGQGGLPDIWLGAVISPPAQPAVLAGIKGVGIAFAGPAALASTVCGYNPTTQEFLVQVHNAPSITFNVYRTPGPCPQVGAPFNPNAPGNTFEGAGVTDNQGNGSWSGNYPPGSGCLVVIQGQVPNAVVIGRFRL